jgi:hypothetical protein
LGYRVQRFKVEVVLVPQRAGEEDVREVVRVDAACVGVGKGAALMAYCAVN